MGTNLPLPKALNEARLRLASDEDYICLKRFEFSLARLLERYPEGCPDRIVAQALLMTEDQVREMYENVVVKLRQLMNVQN
jgi:hypothetical protein